MTSTTSRRTSLAGITLLAAACLIAMPATADSAPKRQDFAGTAGPTRAGSIMNMVQFRATSSQITLMHNLSSCGEFTFIRGKVRNGRFSVTRRFPNGYGVAFRGTVNIATKKLTGQLKTWHGPISAVADDPTTEGIDETIQAQPACNLGWQKIKVKPTKLLY